MREFIKRNKLLSVLFVISIFLMIKNSSIPYPFSPPLVIQFIFNAPTSEFFSNFAGIVDIFTSAYVTSLLFYLIVDYIPALKHEKTAKEIFVPKLVNIYLYMSEIIAMIEYSMEQQGIVLAEDYTPLDDLQFNNTTTFCKKMTLKNGLESGTTPYSYVLPDDCKKYRTLVLNVCRDITGASSFSYCDFSVIQIMSTIQLSELLRIIGTIDDLELQSKYPISHINFGNGYKDFLQIHKSLESVIETKFQYKMIDISDQEKSEWIANSAKFLAEHPDIAEHLNFSKKDE